MAKGTNPEVDLDALAGKILSYLETHGEAADTVEGIARWWIKRQRLEEAVVRVQCALDRLVIEARLQSRVTPSGRTLYMLPGERRPSADGDALEKEVNGKRAGMRANGPVGE